MYLVWEIVEIGYLEQNDDVFLFLFLRKLIYIKEVVLNVKYKMKLLLEVGIFREFIFVMIG